MDDKKETVGVKRQFKVSCCRSYATPKGRCFTCPEDDSREDPDEEVY